VNVDIYNALNSSAVLDQNAKEVILKAVNVGDQPVKAELNLAGAARVRPQAQVALLTGTLTDVNTLDAPRKVAPSVETIEGAATRFAHEFPARSVSVLRIGVRR